MRKMIIGELGFTPAPGRIAQRLEASLLKTVDPVLYSARRISKELRSLSTAHPLGYQQNAVQPVIISSLLISTNFVLQNHHHRIRVGKL